jgi:hypothetical protein
MQSEQSEVHLSRVSRIFRVVCVLDRLLQNIDAIEPAVYRGRINHIETASSRKREDGVDTGEVGQTNCQI